MPGLVTYFLMGDQTVIPAHSRGAASAGLMLSGILTARFPDPLNLSAKPPVFLPPPMIVAAACGHTFCRHRQFVSGVVVRRDMQREGARADVVQTQADCVRRQEHTERSSQNRLPDVSQTMLQKRRSRTLTSLPVMQASHCWQQSLFHPKPTVSPFCKWVTEDPSCSTTPTICIQASS